MPKFAANLSFMFQDIGFLDRFDAAARAGFTAVEFLFPYDHPPERVADSRSSVRYSSPTSFKNFSRCRISTSTFPAMAASSGARSGADPQPEILGSAIAAKRR